MKTECRAMVWKGAYRGYERCRSKSTFAGRCPVHWRSGHCEIDGRYYTPSELSEMKRALPIVEPKTK